MHAYPDGRAPGLVRVQDLGVAAVTFPAAATSEDIAMLLADEHGAALIVAVGTHATLVEFLDKGRAGMASTFLTRLRVGGKLDRRKGREPAVPSTDRGAIAAGARAGRADCHRRRAGRLGRRTLLCHSRCRPLGRPPLLVSGSLVIDFRYHIVSLTAVFLALAVGVVLGTTALKGPILADLRGQVSRLADDNRSLRQDLRDLKSQAGKQDSFAQEVAPVLLNGRLNDKTVTLVRPGPVPTPRTGTPSWPT